MQSACKFTQTVDFTKHYSLKMHKFKFFEQLNIIANEFIRTYKNNNFVRGAQIVDSFKTSTVKAKTTNKRFFFILSFVF